MLCNALSLLLVSANFPTTFYFIAETAFTRLMFNFQFDIFNSVTRLSWKFGLISPTLNLSLVYEFDLVLLYFFKKTFQFYFVVV